VRTVRDELSSHASPLTGELLVETGGGLFGPPLMSWHRDVRIGVANVAATLQSRASMSMSDARLRAEESTLVAHGSELRRIGDWHAHPTRRRDGVGVPSEADMSTWISEIDSLNSERLTARYVGIIGTVGERGWVSTPRLHAWVVRRDDLGRAVCERATVAVSGARAA
jgi:hypothetical protein